MKLVKLNRNACIEEVQYIHVLPVHKIIGMATGMLAIYLQIDHLHDGRF